MIYSVILFDFFFHFLYKKNIPRTIKQIFTYFTHETQCFHDSISIVVASRDVCPSTLRRVKSRGTQFTSFELFTANGGTMSCALYELD